MKIAIQGHPTRGREVIKLLESLGGINNALFKGVKDFWYFIDSNGNIVNDYQFVLIRAGFKTYTLEEFEKEFPFKIGDEVTIVGIPDFPKTITKIAWDCDEILYSFEGLNNTWFGAKSLKKFEMKEERNITLTLEKAKEWYNKGGELKEIALQAFTEKELNSCTEYINLGLPSGILWAIDNEGGYYSYQEAIDTFGKNNLPKLTDFSELYDYCTWKWDDKSKSMIVTGPNGDYIMLPASGYRSSLDGELRDVGSNGSYWSVTPNSLYAYGLYFDDDGRVFPSGNSRRALKFSIRKIKRK